MQFLDFLTIVNSDDGLSMMSESVVEVHSQSETSVAIGGNDHLVFLQFYLLTSLDNLGLDLLGRCSWVRVE